MRLSNLEAKLLSPMTIGYMSAQGVSWSYLQRCLEKNVDYKLLSDYAWNCLRVYSVSELSGAAGKRETAIKLLQALYEKYPAEYNIVANLGTAYELTGENEKALTLLKRAVEINPASHHGSEWIHIKILEEKVKSTPGYNKIINLTVPNDYREWLTGQFYDKSMKADSLMIQLAYQLHERIGFVAPTDPIVGQLVLDFADLVAITHPPYKALEFYRFATTYDPTLAMQVSTRSEIIPPAVNKTKNATKKNK